MTGAPRVLVVNAGSSSLKLRLLAGDDSVLGSVDLAVSGDGFDGLTDALRRVTGEASASGRGASGAASPAPGSRPSGVDAVGHRVVHGGSQYQQAARVDSRVWSDLRALVDLAPLHQPKSLAAMEAVSAALPGVPAVACFDTAFHATIPPAAATYPLPAEWRERHRIRRYGFHGLSHRYAAHRAAELLGRDPAGLRLVTCHLGAGASLAAVHSGRSVDTTMGFTPLEGLMMATRSGSIDPGLVLWLQQHAGLSPDEIGDALEHRSGLLGLAGTADMRAVTNRAGSDATARAALDVYLHRLRAGIAAMTAALSGVDAVVFTGGVGEHSAAVRAGAAGGLRYLGLSIDPDRNTGASADTGDTDISAADASVRALVVAAREDLEIAREVRQVVAG